MTETNPKEWAQLVCSTDMHAAPVPIEEDNFSIGRKACDLSLGDNKFVSGKHCRLRRQSDGKTWLEDTSTNGTWVNETKLSKGQKLQLSHGDEIFVVKRPGTQNVAYIFQETAELAKEMIDETMAYDDDDSEFTEEYKFESKSDEAPDTAAASGGVKRDRPEDSNDERPDAKRLHGDDDTESRDEKSQDKGPKKEKTKDSSESHPVPMSTRISQIPGTSRTDSSAKPDPSTSGAAASSDAKTNKSPGNVSGSDEKVLGASGGEPKLETTTGLGGALPDDQTPEEGPPQDDIAETLTCSICQDIFHDCISLQPCMHSFCAGCYSGWMEMANNCPSCRITVQRINKNHIVNNLVEAYLKEHPDKKRSDEDLKEMDEKNKITREMLIPKAGGARGRGNVDLGLDSYNSDDDGSYDGHSDSQQDSEDNDDDNDRFGFGRPVPIFPLPRPPPRMYNFNICRQCIGYVPPPSTDPNIGTVVVLSPANQTGNSTSVKSPDASLKDKPSTSTAVSNPNLASTSASSSVPPKTDKPKDTSDHPSTLTDPKTDKPKDSSDTPCTSTGLQPSCSSNSAAASSCSSNSAAASSCSSTSATKIPSTSGDNSTHRVRITPSGDVVTMPTAPVYQCNNNANHLMCMCCQKPMPDRRPGFGQPQGAMPPQKCTVCGRFYCHMYWGCQKIDCLGCLNKFKDMNFGDKCMRNFVNNNSAESDILKKYLQSKRKSWKDVLSDSLVKLDAGQYNCPDRQRHRVTSETPVCYTCGMKNFQELAYQYRKDIPRDQLPAEVIARSDCYWGKNCRTQFNKPQHAQRFNHICDQTRF